MVQKKSRKAGTPGAAAAGKDLPVKALSAKTAKGVQGGSIVRLVDKSSPVLYQACATGEHFKK